MNKTKILNKKHLFVGVLSIVLLALVCIFMSACSNGKAKLENTYYASTQDFSSGATISENYTLKYYTNGFFELEVKSEEADTTGVSTAKITGYLNFDENGKLKSGSIASMSGSETVLGQNVPAAETSNSGLINYMIDSCNTAFNSGSVDIRKVDGGIYFKDFLYDEMILQTKNKSLKAGDVVCYLTQEDTLKTRAYYGYNFDGDFYFAQTADYNLATKEGLAAFVYATDFAVTAKVVGDDLVSVEDKTYTITEISGVDLNKPGKQTATVKFKDADDKEFSQKFVFNIVQDKNYFPENLPILVNYCFDDALFDDFVTIEKGSEFGKDGAIDVIYSVGDKSTETPIWDSINNKLADGFTIAGYNKNKIGWQTVTISYYGVSCKVLVFVWDDTNKTTALQVVNDVTSRIEITKSTTDETYSANTDNVNLLIVQANGETRAVEKSAISFDFNSDLSVYNKGEVQVVVATCTVEGKTFKVKVPAGSMA